MNIRSDTTIRLIVFAQLLAMGVIRSYFGAPGRKDAAPSGDRGEPAWLTVTLATIALLHFGAIAAYLINPLIPQLELLRGERDDSLVRHRIQLSRDGRGNLVRRRARHEL
jgi:hypothetical protein